MNKMSGLEPSTSMDRAITHLDSMWSQMAEWLSRAKEAVHWQEKWERTRGYAKQHPMTTMFAVITMAMFSLPITCFFAFAFGSMLFTFMGFMFLEGILLTIGGLLLGGALFIVGFLSLSISSLLAAAWFTASKGQRILASLQQSMSKSRQKALSEKNGLEKDSGSEKEKDSATNGL